MCSIVVRAMPRRLNVRSAAAMMRRRVCSASCLVRRMLEFCLAKERSYIYTLEIVYNSAFLRPHSGPSVRMNLRLLAEKRAYGVCARTRHMVCASLVVVLFACSKQPTDPAPKGPAASPPAIPVTVQRVELQRVPISLEAVGQAEGSREVEIRARVSGILEKRLYSEGAPISAGAVLFVIDKATYEIAVAQAKAALAQESARQEQAQREAERLKQLAQSKAISQREYDEAVSTLKQSSAAIEGAQARLAEAQLNLSYTNVKAPISGITGRAVRSEGSLVTANTESSLLTTLTQVNPIWVRFSLAESDFDRIRGAEKRAQVKLLAPDGTVAANNGRLNFSGTTVDP